MNKTYDPKTIELYWGQEWEKRGYFHFSGQGKPYSILLPPPNVTGSLHMGHGFQISLMDALIRYHRMQGENVLWQGGTDHAGIATQMVVERQLALQGKTRQGLGRKQFLDTVWHWKNTSGGMINQQLRRLGASIDWSRERFTCDMEFSKTVKQVFINLYQAGLIYRSQRLVNWDPHLQTAVSDLEVIANEELGQLWYIRYPLAHGDGQVVVATTRPETLLGDVAVAVHPGDKRYQHLLGQRLIVPLTERIIPLIADASVDPNFGTGCVKITPAHDFQDYALAKRHGLTPITIFTASAHLNQHVPQPYQGLERFTARDQIVSDLADQQLIEKVVPHRLNIPRGDRSGAVIEPYLTDQWFMRMAPLATPVITAIKARQVRFVPDNWSQVCLQWLENLEDWCISRQLWWGHQIPAWYSPDGAVYVADDAEAVHRFYALDPGLSLRQDEDVLDTWFSSALWPFVSLDWPEPNEVFKTFYPTEVLVTGFDILFFWVARMLMLSLYFTQNLPFKTVYVTGLIRDLQGQKMSKSKGNVLDPIDIVEGIDLDHLLEKRSQGLLQPQMATSICQATRQQFPDGITSFGADALRFTYCALASPTRDIRFDLKRIEGYRHFCNKLWNAARFVLSHANDPRDLLQTSESDTVFINRWIRSCLQKTIQQVHQHFTNYRFDLLAQTLYSFIWHEYCDWYLEATKTTGLSPDTTTHQATRYTLVHVLETSLRLLHPIMPFLTEALWQQIAPLAGLKGVSIMLAAYPIPDNIPADIQAEQEMAWLKAIVTAIRTIRSEIAIAPSKKIPLICNRGNAADRQRMTRHQTLITSLAQVTSVSWLTPPQVIPPAATSLVGELELLIPITDLIDVSAEICRLRKALTKWQQALEYSRRKLATTQFVNNAPAVIVDQEKARITACQVQIQTLQQRLLHLDPSSEH